MTARRVQRVLEAASELDAAISELHAAEDGTGLRVDVSLSLIDATAPNELLDVCEIWVRIVHEREIGNSLDGGDEDLVAEGGS
jgi:hypothetical protein